MQIGCGTKLAHLSGAGVGGGGGGGAPQEVVLYASSVSYSLPLQNQTTFPHGGGPGGLYVYSPLVPFCKACALFAMHACSFTRLS